MNSGRGHGKPDQDPPPPDGEPTAAAAGPTRAHPPLAGYRVHTIAGWCQCRCDDCYSRLLGGCWCLACICEDEYDANHNRLARAGPLLGTLALALAGVAVYEWVMVLHG